MRCLVFTAGSELSDCVIATYSRLNVRQPSIKINCIKFIGCVSLVIEDNLVKLVILALNVFL